MTETTHGPRERLVTWDDPMTSARAVGTMPGLEFLRAMVRGELPAPPIAHLLGFTIVEVEHGRVVFEVVPGEQHYNPIGVVHGGLAATLLDSAMGCAVNSVLPAGVGYTTVDLHVQYVRALTAATGLVRAEGTVVHGGSRLLTAEGRVTDAAGKLYAHATTTCITLPVPPRA